MPAGDYVSVFVRRVTFDVQNGPENREPNLFLQSLSKPSDVRALLERTGKENYCTPTSGTTARLALHLKKMRPTGFNVSIAASQEMKQINIGDYCARSSGRAHTRYSPRS